MVECKHIWHVTEWITQEIAFKRVCLLCKKKEKRDYLGGSMWRWEDES